MEGLNQTAGRSLGTNQQYAWKECTYPAPVASRRRFEWKASALRGLEHLHHMQVSGQPITVVVPALYNSLPAEAVALGWLNDINALNTIRHRIMEAAKLTGWDVFTFHTHHNLDSFFDSNIATVRDTWLREGSLNRNSVAESLRRFGRPYEYHRIHARLVENLVFQSSLMGWLTVHAADTPLRFHLVGTALISGLVWSGALSFEEAVRTAARTGARWDEGVAAIAEQDLERSQTARSEENLGWQRFHRVRQVIEGRTALSLPSCPEDLPQAAPPARPFWFSATAGDEPVLIQTAQDVRTALEAMNLASWSPKHPKPLADDRIRGWLVSALHPMSSACRWSVYNYLLATPASTLLFLHHIAELGRIPAGAPSEVFQNRLRLSRMKVTGP